MIKVLEAKYTISAFELEVVDDIDEIKNVVKKLLCGFIAKELEKEVKENVRIIQSRDEHKGDIIFNADVVIMSADRLKAMRELANKYVFEYTDSTGKKITLRELLY